MEKRVRFFADEVEQTALDMEKLVVDFADEVEGLENEINKTAYAVENAAYQLDQTPFGPFDPEVDKPPSESTKSPHDGDKASKESEKSGKKFFRPGRNFDRLLKRMDKDQKGDDVVKTKSFKPTTNWERILRKWDRNNKKIDPKLLKGHNGDLEKQLYVTLCQEEEQVLDNGEEEDEFLSAVEKGDINTFMEMLAKKEQIWLNIECKDSNGMSALRIAIAQGYAVIVEQLLLQGVYVGDALLRSVDIGLPDTVKKICEFAEKIPTKEERYTIMECHCDNDDFHQDVTPIVLAAQRNDFTIVKILLDYGVRITEVSQKQTESATQVDTLLKSVGTLEVYKALSADAYVSQAYLDPIDRSFDLSAVLLKLSKTDVEFKHTYIELGTNVDEIGRDVISHCRNTEEIMTVLTHHDKKKESKVDPENEEVDKHVGPLPMLTRAISFGQKHFVAQPNCQQAVLAKFYGRLAYLRDRSPMFRRLLFLAVVLCFPFISLAYLYVPTTWVKNNIGCPYTKFMLQLSSDLIFVFLLTCDTLLSDGVYTIFTLTRPTKALLLLWIIGIAWREVKAYRRRGPAIFSQGKHLRDSALAFLFFVGIVFDITHYQEVLNTPPGNGTNITDDAQPIIRDRERRAFLNDNLSFENHVNHSVTNLSGYEYNETDDEDIMVELSPGITGNLSDEAVFVHRIPTIPIARAKIKLTNVKSAVVGGGGGGAQTEVTDSYFLQFLGLDWWHPRLIATGFFALATVISFLRMLPYVVVSDVIGPLQISLGTMITETAHFFLVVGVVVVSFSVGLTYIYAYYELTKFKQCVHTNDGNDDLCDGGTLPNLYKVVIYLYWSVFGLESMEPLKLSTQAWILQAAGTTLYALFYILVVVVLLNALIAVMSNVYNEIEENGDIEWKFASTELWMDVLMDDDVAPAPFNLLPSKETLETTWQRIVRRCRHFRAKNFVDHNGCKYTGPSKLNKRNGKNSKNGKSKTKERSHYQRVMGRLVERYVAAKTAGEVSVEADVGIADIRALRNDLVALKFEMYNKLVETNDDIVNAIHYGSSVHTKCKETDGLFDYTEEVRGRVLKHDDHLADLNSIFQENYAKVPPSRPPSPPPPPPPVADVGIMTDPPPPPPPPRPIPPPPIKRSLHTQITPPPTPPPSPTFSDLFTQVTPPPSPPIMITRHTEIDPALVRFELRRASIIAGAPNALRPPIGGKKDDTWRPFGKPKPKDSRSPRISPDQIKSSGYGIGRKTPSRGSPSVSRSSSISSGTSSLSPESLRKAFGSNTKFSRSSSSRTPSSAGSSRRSSTAGSFDEILPPTPPPPANPRPAKSRFSEVKPKNSSQLTTPPKSVAGKTAKTSATPVKSGTTSSKTGATKPKTGVTATKPGTTSAKAGVTTKPGTTSAKTGATLKQSVPSQNAVNPKTSSTNPSKSGTKPSKASSNPKSGTKPTKTNSNPSSRKSSLSSVNSDTSLTKAGSHPSRKSSLSSLNSDSSFTKAGSHPSRKSSLSSLSSDASTTKPSKKPSSKTSIPSTDTKPSKAAIRPKTLNPSDDVKQKKTGGDPSPNILSASGKASPAKAGSRPKTLNPGGNIKPKKAGSDPSPSRLSTSSNASLAKAGSRPSSRASNPSHDPSPASKTGSHPTSKKSKPSSDAKTAKLGSDPTLKTQKNNRDVSPSSSATSNPINDVEPAKASSNSSSKTSNPSTNAKTTKSGTGAYPSSKTTNPGTGAKTTKAKTGTASTFKSTNPSKTGTPGQLKTRPAAPSHKPKSPKPSGRP